MKTPGETMKSFLFFAIVFACCGAGYAGGQDLPLEKQGPPSAQEGISAAEVLDKYLAATGGVEARRALQSMESHGRFGLEGFHSRFRVAGLGDFHFYYKRPNNDAFELEHAQGGVHGFTTIGRNHGERFIRRTARSNWAINGVGLDSLEQAWLALAEWDFSERYSQIKLVGNSDVDGKPAYALLFTPREGDPQIRYYDKASFLLVRIDLVGRFRPKEGGPETRRKVESYYSDYQETAGIKFPRLIIAIGTPGIPKDRVEFVVNSVKTNGAVDDAVFKTE
jgi:hypothetical protein